MSSSSEQRKVLEEIQKTKSHLLKQGAAASLLPYNSSSSSTIINNNNNSGIGTNVSDIHITPAQRSANQVLQQANSTSFGYFISQESVFGNAILPVLPRFDKEKDGKEVKEK